MNIYTHDGTFHSDEVFAVALLKMFLKRNSKIIRTRDDSVLKNAKLDKQSFVIDVGGEYNEKYRNFDHHQRSFKFHWKNTNILFSSCGLIWNFLKKKGYLKKYDNEVLIKIENDIIKKIDMHDNGFKNWNLSQFISKCNREENNINDFEKAVSLAESYLENSFYHENLNLLKYDIFIKDLDKYNPKEQFFISKTTIKDARVLNKISNDTNALFIIYPQFEDGKEDSWMIKSVNHYNEKGEKINLLAPEEWRGETGNRLAKKTDIKGLLFVHKTGFLIGVRTLNQAIKVAKHIIERKDKDNKDKKKVA